ncbi:MAG: hypothetical protein GC160_17700 [Acidobacteria bacterium]|nr:hypothetical protein [Acidobacteriota bacterium]
MSFAKLFEPFRLPRSGKLLKNRLVMAPMPTFGADADGSAGASELAYYRRRAEGGLAAIVTAGCAVAEDGVAFPGNWRCDHDGLTGSLERCAAAIREGGALAIAQLSHAGAGAGSLDEADAARLIGSFSAAARRVRQAGFDGVALHGGHRELLQQLFSAKTNSRAWRWGGPRLADRARFPRAVVEAVCEAFGGPCWYRLDPEEPGEGGIALDQTLELAELLCAAGVEALDVAAKDYFAGSVRDPDDARPRAAALAESLGERCAVMAVGGLGLPEQGVRALEQGPALIGLGRVLLGEPDWPRKVSAGQSDSLRLELDDDTRLEALAVPPPVIEYLRRRAGERRYLSMSAAPKTAADPLLEAFWDEGLVLFGDRVAEEYALHTPIFIDLRHRLYDHLETLSALGKALCDKICELAPPEAAQQVIGIPDTATPIALATALASRGRDRAIAYGQLRKKPANYPGGRSGASAYMGIGDRSREITLLDDVMASGRTKLWSIEELAKDGLSVTRILVVVDREQGGARILREQGYPVHALYNVSEMIEYYAADGRIDQKTAARAREHVARRRFS